MIRSKHNLPTRRAIQHRIAAVLLIAGTALAAFGWTGYAHGQNEIRRVGILSLTAADEGPAWESNLKILRRTLADRGWIEGKNVTFEFRNAQGNPSNFAAAATALVELKVDVINAISAPSLRAAQAATSTIPIVGIDYTADPIADGYIQSYGRPGGNVTGVFLDAPEFAGKWFELLKAMLPDLSRIAVLWDPTPGITHLRATRSIAESLNINLEILEVHTPNDIDKAFAQMKDPQAVIILPSPIIYSESERLARLALKYRVPAISFARQFADAGGAIAYGPADHSAIESVAVLIAKVLDGVKPAELPIERPTKVHLIVNLKTAKVLGLTIPESILLRADEVIR